MRKSTDIPNLLHDEVAWSLETSGYPARPSRRLTVLADAANSMGATYLDALFSALPHRLVRMNFRILPVPVHAADPMRPENLVDIRGRARKIHPDLGLAPDGDGDRLFFLDERGAVVPPSSVVAIIAREILIQHPGEKILFDVRSTFTPSRVVEECGGTCLVTKVGHTFITEALHASGGVFAGESSAHFYFREAGNVESPLLAILYVLGAMERTGKKLSELSREVRRSRESGEINFRVSDVAQAIRKVKSHYRKGKINEMDGLAIDFPTWRFSLRPSANDPLLRLNVEELLTGSGKRHEELVALIKPFVVQ